MTTFSSFLRDFDSVLAAQAPYQARSYQPSSEVAEAEDHYLVSFDVPGVAKEDLDIELEKSVLTVKGERKGRLAGKFQRAVSLPQGVTAEQLEATHENGVLTIKVPKPKAAQRTRIRIGEAQPASAQLAS